MKFVNPRKTEQTTAHFPLSLTDGRVAVSFFFVLKRSLFESRSQRSNQKKNLSSQTKKSSKKCLKWEIMLKCTYFGTFRTISQFDDLRSFFWLLR